MKYLLSFAWTGIYEMKTYSIANGIPLHHDEKIKELVKMQSKCECDLIGAWYNDSGDLSKGECYENTSFYFQTTLLKLENGKIYVFNGVVWVLQFIGATP